MIIYIPIFNKLKNQISVVDKNIQFLMKLNANNPKIKNKILLSFEYIIACSNYIVLKTAYNYIIIFLYISGFVT